jgi:hypothetical protein
MSPSRRRLLQTLALVAAQNTLACRQADPEHRFTIDVLRGASAVHGTGLSKERLEKIRAGVERNLEQLEAVRRFDLDEKVEPATRFLASG